MVCGQTRGRGIRDAAFDKGPDIVTPLLIQAIRLCEHIRWSAPTKARNGGEFGVLRG